MAPATGCSSRRLRTSTACWWTSCPQREPLLEPRRQQADVVLDVSLPEAPLQDLVTDGLGPLIVQTFDEREQGAHAAMEILSPPFHEPVGVEEHGCPGAQHLRPLLVHPFGRNPEQAPPRRGSEEFELARTATEHGRVSGIGPQQRA